jgi:hypothetical protein
MRFVFALAMIAFSTPVFASDMDEKPEWYACEKDADCAIDAGLCYGIVAINKNAQVNYEEYLHKTRPVIDCPVGGALLNKDKVRAICVGQKCILNPKPIYAEHK